MNAPDTSGVATLLALHREHCGGNPYAQVLCLSTRPLSADSPVAEALSKAFAALGYGTEELGFLICPQQDGDSSWDFQTARWCLEVFDPLAVIAVDQGCLPFVRSLVRNARLQVGERGVHNGRGYLVLEDFAGALDDDQAKRVAWHQMRQLEKGLF